MLIYSLRWFLPLAFTLCAHTGVFSQSVRQLSEDDRAFLDQSISSFQYLDAAERYLDIFDRTGEQYWIFNAFSCFLQSGTNRIATERIDLKSCYWSYYEMANAFKLQSKSDSARKYYEIFIDSYKGDYFDEVLSIIEREIAGLNLTHLVKDLEPVSSKVYDKDISISFISEPISGELLLNADTILISKGDTMIISTEFNDQKNQYQLMLSRRFIKRNSEWLPNIINQEGVHCIHPHLTYWREKFLLFFSTNRKGSKGGFDIWMSIYDPDQDFFSAPVNTGDQLNTIHNEIAPIFDIASERLYFSSNGHISMGSYDINYAYLDGLQWRGVTNCMLYNTPGSDFMIKATRSVKKYVHQKGHSNSYVLHYSISTPDSTLILFQFMPTETDMMLDVLEQNDTVFSSILINDSLSILLKNKTKYQLFFSSDGYETTQFELNLDDYLPNKTVQIPSLKLDKNLQIVSYKIQLAAVKNIRMNLFDLVRMYGDISIHSTDNNLSRIILTTWNSEKRAEVERYLSQIREFSWFEDAFIVTYINGIRQ